MGKFYAVKNGYHTGIYNTWEDCEREVKGYGGAQYKSFKRIEDAEEYLGINTQMSFFDEDIPETNTAVAYVDGSYNTETKIFGCGVVIFHNGEEKTFSRSFSDPEMASMRNVAGEIEGAKLAMRFCVDNNIEEIDIYYDYEGIEKWCSGAWKTNKDGTAAYKRYYDEAARKVRINFVKVKGHSGDKYNDMADRLAKEAVGVI
ncbi:MAG: ribonuclease H family protein [Oscillospiraceae bacterium]|nr:ribonuclease H family protein [Oscillospiraceae bacterium]